MTRSITAVIMLLAVLSIGAGKGSVSPYESPATLTGDNPIDKLVLDKLQQLKIEPANVCSDAVFVRRVFLDTIGALPTGQEAREFLNSTDPNKRRALIDKLLEREEFAEYWSLKWADLLRVKAEFPINLWPNAVQAYHRWILTSIRQNKPYDKFARELLTSSGSNFRVAPVNFYRAVQSKEPAGLAQAVALTFMGSRTEAWPKERVAGMAAFFSQIGFKATGEWKEEIVCFDLMKAGKGVPTGAIFPDGTMAKLQPDQDPREAFANWLIDPKNPWFTKNIANRVWSWLLGRGIINEPDDIRPDNPAKNPELLAYLEKELIGAKYDLKHLYRLILNSKTYQLSCIPKTNDPQAEAYFAQYPLRRLDAEVLADALCQITGSTEKYSSPIPEPFTFVPEYQRSVLLADGSTTSAFLEMFGRPARDSGFESERNNKPSASQRLHLLNSSHIQKKLENSRKLTILINQNVTGRELVNQIYLMTLSRLPTEDELFTFHKYPHTGPGKGREAVLDLIWALINTDEFLYRH